MEPNYIYVNTKTNISFENTCRNNLKKYLLGTYLIHFSKCEIILNEVSYKDVQHIFWESIELIPVLHEIKLKEIEINKNMSLHRLATWSTNNTKSIEILFQKSRTTTVDILTALSSLSTISIIIICILVYCKMSNKAVTTHTEKTAANTDVPTVHSTTITLNPSLWSVNNPSEDGGVMGTNRFPPHIPKTQQATCSSSE